MPLWPPREHHVTRSVDLAASPQAAWDRIADFAAQTAWRRALKSVERLPDREGLPCWRENGTAYITRDAVPPRGSSARSPIRAPGAGPGPSP